MGIQSNESTDSDVCVCDTDNEVIIQTTLKIKCSIKEVRCERTKLSVHNDRGRAAWADWKAIHLTFEGNGIPIHFLIYSFLCYKKKRVMNHVKH